MPSVTEVNPLCLGESLAAGTPVVAVDSFAARQCLCDGEDALLSSHNLADFSATVLRLWNDQSQYQQMSSRAMANAEVYALPKQVDSLLTFYKQIITRSAN